MNGMLELPEIIKEEPWMGGLRRIFLWNNVECQIVEPPEPRADKLWFWLPEWPTAFPARNGVKELLAMGYFMARVNVFGKFANDEALGIMKKFYDFLRSLGFAQKAAFIGMSLGGLYSFRFVEQYPETAACIYADAPVCNLYRPNRPEICQAYGVKFLEELRDHPLAPVNHLSAMVRANIPLLLILGMADTVVDPVTNGVLLAERWQKQGGSVRVIKRESWGHHPHGLDDPMPIVRFILENTMGKGL